jgi:Tol biopolymer transport system component
VEGNVESLLWGTTLGNLAASSIWIVPATGGNPTRITDLIHHNTSPVWARDGSHVLFVSSLGGGRDIYSQRVNGKGQPVGEPDRLTTGLYPHSISINTDGGVLAYSAFRTSANIWTARLNGTQRLRPETFRQITWGNQTIEAVSVSADDRWLAFDSNINGNSDIYKLPVEGGDPQQLTRDRADEFNPQWSPDGSEIAFHGFSEGNRDIFVVSSDGSRRELVVGLPADDRVPVWSPDGKQLAYQRFPDSLMVVRRTATGWGEPSLLVRGVTPSWAPDNSAVAFVQGTRLATISPNGGPVTFVTEPNAVAAAGPDEIAWSKDSRLLYYATSDDDGMNRIMVVSARGGMPVPIWTPSDPLRQIYRPGLNVSSSNVYFTLGARESDIWVMELKRK